MVQYAGVVALDRDLTAHDRRLSPESRDTVVAVRWPRTSTSLCPRGPSTPSSAHWGTGTEFVAAAIPPQPADHSRQRLQPPRHAPPESRVCGRRRDADAGAGCASRELAGGRRRPPPVNWCRPLSLPPSREGRVGTANCDRLGQPGPVLPCSWRCLVPPTLALPYGWGGRIAWPIRRALSGNAEQSLAARSRHPAHHRKTMSEAPLGLRTASREGATNHKLNCQRTGGRDDRVLRHHPETDWLSLAPATRPQHRVHHDLRGSRAASPFSAPGATAPAARFRRTRRSSTAAASDTTTPLAG